MRICLLYGSVFTTIYFQRLNLPHSIHSLFLRIKGPRNRTFSTKSKPISKDWFELILKKSMQSLPSNVKVWNSLPSTVNQYLHVIQYPDEYPSAGFNYIFCHGKWPTSSLYCKSPEFMVLSENSALYPVPVTNHYVASQNVCRLRDIDKTISIIFLIVPLSVNPNSTPKKIYHLTVYPNEYM